MIKISGQLTTFQPQLVWYGVILRTWQAAPPKIVHLDPGKACMLLKGILFRLILKTKISVESVATGAIFLTFSDHLCARECLSSRRQDLCAVDTRFKMQLAPCERVRSL